MKIAAVCVLLAILWVAFRVRWWRRVHYHTLLGRTLPMDEVRSTLVDVLVETDRVLAAAGLAYWLDAGTLLGAYRDGKFIPWDDDLDICILHDDFDRLLALADQFRPPYRLVRISRFWSIDKVFPGLQRFWPCGTFLRLLDTSKQLYVDIFSAAQRPDGRLEILPLSDFHRPKNSAGGIYSVPRDVVFPLTQIGFEGRTYPAPHQVLAYLNEYYGADLAPDHEWDPVRRRYVRRQKPAASEPSPAHTISDGAE